MLVQGWNRVLRAPEGGASGGEGAPAGGEGSPSADKGAAGGGEGGKERPDWLPEAYWDSEKGEGKFEDLAKSHADITKKITTRNDDLKKQVKADFEKERFAKRPEAADKYELRLPEGVLPDGVEWEFNAEDPLVNFARNLAYENGLGQEGFDKLVGEYIKSEIAKLPDVEAQVKRLGEKGPERVARIDQWLSVNMSKGAYAALSSVAKNAEVLIAIEELMMRAGAPAFVVDSDPGGDQQILTDAVVRSWQADPKYWDPVKRDPTFVKKVEDAWKKLYPANKK